MTQRDGLPSISSGVQEERNGCNYLRFLGSFEKKNIFIYVEKVFSFEQLSINFCRYLCHVQRRSRSHDKSFAGDAFFLAKSSRTGECSNTKSSNTFSESSIAAPEWKIHIPCDSGSMQPAIDKLQEFSFKRSTTSFQERLWEKKQKLHALPRACDNLLTFFIHWFRFSPRHLEMCNVSRFKSCITCATLSRCCKSNYRPAFCDW